MAEGDKRAGWAFQMGQPTARKSSSTGRPGGANYRCAATQSKAAGGWGGRAWDQTNTLTTATFNITVISS